MNIDKKLDGEKLFIELEGSLDTTTAPILEEELENLLNDVKTIVFDLEKLEYISSAGLRVILATQQRMMEHGEMKLTHVNDEVMEVFYITGFSNILNIESI